MTRLMSRSPSSALKAFEPGCKNQSMFPPRKNGNAQRSLVRALLTIFVGTFLLASQPRIPEIFAHPIPDRESKYLNVGEFLDAAIVGHGLKSGDFQNQVRLFTASISRSDSRQKVVLRAADRSAVYSDPPTIGSFLIRSPPSDTVT